MIDADREREHLAQANRHIARGQKYIAEQKRLIEKLEHGGHDIDVAMSMLRALEQALRAFERHRELILKRLKDEKPRVHRRWSGRPRRSGVNDYERTRPFHQSR